MRSPNLLLRWALGCASLAAHWASAGADEFVLQTGARVRGQWLNRTDASSPFYLMATEHGGRVKLERSRVVEVVPLSEARDKYDRLAPTVADTAADQWKLAKWCRDNDLPEQCEQHLRRVIELDSEHEQAYRALGYSEIGGQWVKQEEYLQRNGYVRYKGKWQLSQEIELAERRQAAEVAKKQ